MWDNGGYGFAREARAWSGVERRVMKHIRDAWPVILIVATIAGAAWTAAWNVRGFLTTQIAESESRVTTRIAHSEARLTTQIAEIRQYIVEHLREHADPE